MNTTRNDVKQLAQQIETLAREIQMKLDSGTDFISTANELARNNVTLIFTMGEVYALERSASSKGTVTGTVVKSGKSRNYHNRRDAMGRFTSK